ncbi:MAG TPA: hypothetical protein VH079_19400 [Terriglobales bacterium]|jgi:uncharacterized coiled-coil protein SlyX|nr:hypothetical protein [Terriglobales bacterium]
MAETMSKFRFTLHRRYERYCTLAATGQLGGPEMFELNEHVASCSSCREYLESISQVSVQAMPLLAANRGPETDAQPPEGMRERFLSRLATEGSGLPTKQPLAMPRAIAASPREIDYKTFNRTVSTDPTRLAAGKITRSWLVAAAVAACAVIGITGFYLGKRTLSPNTKEIAKTTAATPVLLPAKPDDSQRLADLERQKAGLEKQLADLMRRLTQSTTEQDSLKQELSAARDKLASLDHQPASQPQVTASQTPDATNQLAILQSEVHRLNQRLAEAEINVGIQKQTSQDLTAKLEMTSEELQRERDLKSAKNELGDVLAARNLHIVDVYDADGSGKRQRSFGRVFYIKGKSLVFYAYDLEDPHQFKANVVFHVWGGQAGMKEVTHSLGILHKDDTGQGRWAMTFDDSKVLSQINSVFVTAESGNKRYDTPQGKKVLYAYFGGQANHP